MFGSLKPILQRRVERATNWQFKEREEEVEGEKLEMKLLPQLTTLPKNCYLSMTKKNHVWYIHAATIL